MGYTDDVSKSNSGKTTSDPKATSHGGDENSVNVRNSSTIVDHDSGTHDTIWSKTTVDTRTGDSKSEEGGHGPNYNKDK